MSWEIIVVLIHKMNVGTYVVLKRKYNVLVWTIGRLVVYPLRLIVFVLLGTWVSSRID